MLAADTPSLRDACAGPPHRAPTPGGGFQRFALKAQTNVVGAQHRAVEGQLELDGNAGEGVLTFAADGRQTLQGTLAVERARPHALYVGVPPAHRRADWSRLPLELDALSGIDVDLRHVGGAGHARRLQARPHRGRRQSARRQLTLAIGESQAFGGVIKGSLALAKSTAGADLKAQLQFTEVDARPDASAPLRRPPDRRHGRYRRRVDGTGGSIYELTKALNGTVTLASRKGAITGFNVEQLLKRLERNPLAVRGGDFRGGTHAL